MDRRCVPCNKAISEENIMNQIEFDYRLAFDLFDYEEIDPGVFVTKIPKHLESGGPSLVLSENGDWRHEWCQDAIGTGMTGEELLFEFWKGIQGLDK